MIELNIDLTYLAKYFEIGTSRLNRYTTKNINEIMEQEAAAGNYKAANYKSILSDPKEVLKMFRLADSFNRYMIIKNLNNDDLCSLLKHLPKDDLVWGLKYFTMDKLMGMINELPKKELMKVVFEKFTLKDIMKLMPEDKMDEFLKNDKVEKNDVMKYFQKLDKKDLDRIMGGILNKDMKNESREEMLNFMGNLDDKKFQEFILKMEREDKANLIMGLCAEKPKLMMEFDSEDLSKPMMMIEKAEILKCLNVLDPEFIIPMVEELPQDLIQVVATQIDPEIFADMLIDKFPDILSQISL